MLHLMLLSATELVRAALRGLLARLHVDERGQDTAEYLVMTGVVVMIIALIVWGLYSGALQDLVEQLAGMLNLDNFDVTPA